jgi:poly(ADP-ribose) glycohydrolase ARH3
VALAAASDPTTPLDARRFLDAIEPCHGLPVFSTRLTRLRYVLQDGRPDRARRALGNGARALQSVPAAILAFLRAPDDPERVVKFAVKLGGATDSVAAMAGALVGARVGAAGLPQDLLARLEAGAAISRCAEVLSCSLDRARPAVAG